jgi:DNA-binding NtrC family response regulator
LWQQTKKKTFKFDLLNKFCNNLYQSFPNFEKLYELVPQQLLQIMNCENAAFFLFDETGLQIKTWAPHSFSKESQNTAFFQKMNQVLQDEGPKIFKLHKVKKFGKTFCFPLLETELHPQGVLLIEKEHLDSIDEEIFNGYGELIETVLTQIKEYQKEENRVDSTTVEMTFLTKTLMMENFTQSIPYKYENFIGGRTPAVKKMTHIMDKMTFSHLPVLLIGEAETGKKTIAEILHREGPWCNHNFVSVNCASLAPELLDSQLFGVLKGAFTDARNDMEGFLSQANGGTLFLENIEEISPSLQIKLLRVLQNGEYQPLGSSEIKTAHFRLIVSAKRDPKELVRLGKFREDLFFRFNVGRIQVPPLRKRKEEIPFIIDHLLEKISLKLGKPKKHLLPAALKILCFFPWPGNFLQLENILNQLYILHRKKRIDLNDLPDEVLPEREDRSESVILPLDVAKTKFQKEYIFRLLNFAQGNVTQAAKLSGLPRQTVNRHKRNYGIYP